MRVFDQVVDRPTHYQRWPQSSFDYYNTDGKPFSSAFRALFEEWFGALPESCKGQILGRYRSNKENHHHGAFFEVYLHRLLTTQRVAVSVEPRVQGQSHGPDFLVETREGKKIYIEATVLVDPDLKVDALHEELLNKLEKSFPSEVFFIRVHVNGELRGGTNYGNFITEVRVWLSESSSLETGFRQHTFELTGVDSTIEISLLPRLFRRPGDRICTGGCDKSRWGGAEIEMTRALVAKKRQRIDPDSPFVIALNVHPFSG